MSIEHPSTPGMRGYSVCGLIDEMAAFSVMAPRKLAVFDDASPYLDRFGLLLGVTGVAIVGLSLIELGAKDSNRGPAVAGVCASALAGFTLLLALRASGFAKRWQRITDVAVSLGLLTLVLLILLPNLAGNLGGVDSATPSALLVVLAALSPIVVIRRLSKHREVSKGTLLGAISGYLLIGVGYFYVFTAIDAYAPEPFFGQDEPTTSFMYFSLSNLTTLGYGDLAAANPLGRLLATTEAVAGQIYLVIFVALLVGLAVRGWKQH